MGSQNNQQQKKSIWGLLTAIAFIGIGLFRVYNHFYSEEISYNNFRVILAIAFIIYGAYRLYYYLKTE